MEIKNNQEVDDNQLHNYLLLHPRANEFYSFWSHVGVAEG